VSADCLGKKGVLVVRDCRLAFSFRFHPSSLAPTHHPPPTTLHLDIYTPTNPTITITPNPRPTTSYGTIIDARVMPNQCYGFVEFSTQLEAQESLLAARAGAILIDGRTVRVDWAQGELPGWKRTEGGGGEGGRAAGRPGGHRRHRAGGYGSGGDRLRAAGAPLLLIGTGAGGGMGAAAAAAAVAIVPLAAGGAGAPKPLLSYDDL